MCELSELSGRTCHVPGTIEYWYHLHSVWHLHLQFSSLGDFQLGLNVTPTSQKCIRWVEWKTITHTHLLLCVFHMHPELWTKSLFLEDLPSLPAHVKKKKKRCGKLSLSQKQSGKERILGVWVQMLPTGWPFWSLFHVPLWSTPWRWAPWQGALGGAGFYVPEPCCMDGSSASVCSDAKGFLWPPVSFPNLLRATHCLLSSPLSGPGWSKDGFRHALDPKIDHLWSCPPLTSSV